MICVYCHTYTAKTRNTLSQHVSRHHRQEHMAQNRKWKKMGDLWNHYTLSVFQLNNPALIVLKPDYFAEKLTLCIINKFNLNLNWIGRVRSHLISQYIINKEYTLTKKPAYLWVDLSVSSSHRQELSYSLFIRTANCWKLTQ